MYLLKCQNCKDLFVNKYYTKIYCFKCALTIRREKDLIRKKKYYKANPSKFKERNRLWARNNPDKVNALNKKWRLANPEKTKNSIIKWVKTHPEKVSEYHRRYRGKDPQAWIERTLKWIREHPKEDRERVHRRYIKRHGAQGIHTKADFETLCIVNDWRCTYCGCLLNDENITEDHMIPITRGGNDNIENITPCCRSCNSKKGTKTKDEFTQLLVNV